MKRIPKVRYLRTNTNSRKLLDVQAWWKKREFVNERNLSFAAKESHFSHLIYGILLLRPLSCPNFSLSLSGLPFGLFVTVCTKKQKVGHIFLWKNSKVLLTLKIFWPLFVFFPYFMDWPFLKLPMAKICFFDI